MAVVASHWNTIDTLYRKILINTYLYGTYNAYAGKENKRRELDFTSLDV